MNKALFRLATGFCLVGLGALSFHRFACDRHGGDNPGPYLLPATASEYLESIALGHRLQERLEMSYRRNLA